MAGRTGYTPTPAVFDPQVHMDAIYAHFDTRVGETVANAAALPASLNWVGRTITTVDNGTLYLCTALPSTWTVVREDTGWLQAGAAGGPSLGAGWTNVVAPGIPWDGLWARRVAGVVHLHGPVTKAPFVSLETVLTMPSGWRPAKPAVGVASTGSYCIIRADGTLSPVVNGTGQLTISATYPVG